MQPGRPVGPAHADAMALTGSSCRLHARLCLTLIGNARPVAGLRAGWRADRHVNLEIYALRRRTSMPKPLDCGEQICHVGCGRAARRAWAGGLASPCRRKAGPDGKSRMSLRPMPGEDRMRRTTSPRRARSGGSRCQRNGDRGRTPPIGVANSITARMRSAASLPRALAGRYVPASPGTLERQWLCAGVNTPRKRIFPDARRS